MAADDWPYPSRRERLPVIEALLADGRTRKEIGVELGISEGYVGAIITDPDGLKERARKDSYRGVCSECGGPTDGSAGPGKAPGTCMACITAGASPQASTRRRTAGTRRADVEFLREEGYTSQETADELGLSVGYVETLRARRRRNITREECLAAVVSWIEENGRLPRSTDFGTRALRGPGRPSSGPVYRTLGIRDERVERERVEVERLRHFGNKWDREWARRWVPRPRWSDVLANAAPHIPAELVVSHRNAFVRSEMMLAHGIERVMAEVGTLAHQDDWGKLWRLDLHAEVVGEGEDGRPIYRAGREPLVFVEVVNSTPEPDGSFKDYFLRVPPDSTTAHGAVAWTFAVDEDDYHPLVET